MPVDSVRGVFVEGEEVYPGAGFREKTHVQLCIRNLDCIKGVFRVPRHNSQQVSHRLWRWTPQGSAFPA